MSTSLTPSGQHVGQVGGEMHTQHDNPVVANPQHVTCSADQTNQNADGDLSISEPADLFNRSIMLTAIIAPFVGLLAAIYYCWTVGWMGWPYLVLLVITWMVSGMGVTIGFHRLLTHNSFETYPPIRALLMMMGALSVEGSPLVWCAVHRRHHELSDKLGDPHSPNLHGSGLWSSIKGFWYGHCGWLLTTFWSQPDLKRYVPDLLRDRLLVGVDRMYYLWVLLSLAIPTGIGWLITFSWEGAFLGLLWGGSGPHLCRAPHHLVDQFGVPHLRRHPVPLKRSIDQQPDLRPLGIWRRMAQQPSRLPHVRSTRPLVVAVRHQLADHSGPGETGPGMECQSPQPGGD